MMQILEAMIPVSPDKYNYTKIKTKPVWINEFDYYEEVHVEKFNCAGYLVIYHNDQKTKACSLSALFLPKRKLFDEKWEKIQDIVDIKFNIQ